MKKIVVIMLLVLVFLMIFTSNSASIIVQPAEIYIKMSNNFIQGNTTKKVVVTNVENHTVNVLAYLENPYPDYIRSNRNPLQNLSWITIVPFQSTLQPGSSKAFYLYLTIPEKYHETLLGKKWEVWATFREEPTNDSTSNTFVREYSVRVYIDTPQSIVSLESLRALISIYLILIASMVIFSFIILRYNKKRMKR